MWCCSRGRPKAAASSPEEPPLAPEDIALSPRATQPLRAPSEVSRESLFGAVEEDDGCLVEALIARTLPTLRQLQGDRGPHGLGVPSQPGA